jgi:hypothetical protein
MVLFEIVVNAVRWSVDTLGWRGIPVVAVAALLVGFHYVRESAGLLITLARWVRIGGLLVVGLSGILIIGVSTGALSVDSGIVPKILDVITSLVNL